MKKMMALSVAIGFASLSACDSHPREQAADNIEASAEATADNLEDAADNAAISATADALENKADAVRNEGDLKAEDMRTHDPDTNLANGI